MKLTAPNGPLLGEVRLPISKSIANRKLIISALAGKELKLPGTLPEDVRVLQNALASDSTEVNIGMAGTAMRFLTAYYSVQEGKEIVLTGDERMQQRPIRELVNALNQLGANISYLETEGYPPLKIRGKKLIGGNVIIPASVSSQFISAMMLIAPSMQNGLEVKLSGKILSRPYLELTADCMRQCGINIKFEKDAISIKNGKYQILTTEIETDWSSASYFYAMAAAKPNSKLLLNGLNLESPQGDSILSSWFENLGVSSIQKESGVEIFSNGIIDFPKEMDFTDNPDLAQTVAFLAAALGKEVELTGLSNLRIKETDRIAALQSELKKLGLNISVSENSLQIKGAISVENATIRTYNDHRMAMSAAIVSFHVGAYGNTPTVEIKNPNVVAKSFPDFWKELIGIGYSAK
ncbi:MAG: 3-phosphoshikimate 1-carboxyvinyltransferase [Flavobacteriales bacterium]|nr:3-phosphoshikimate 1-carboxyvinyltransferase [Flavobacteriales bacterium]